MSSFTAPLEVEVEQGEVDGRGLARLIAPFDYYVGAMGSLDKLTVPRGFETDFCSIPRWAMPWFPVMGRAAKAAVIHDYLLTIRDRPKAACDRVFLEAMTVLKVSWLRRTLMYLAVRTRGWPLGSRA